MNVAVLSFDGSRVGEVALRDEIFAAKVNVPLMHQVVTAQLAAARAGTHSTKTRGEVRGGGVKPWRQKGTGRARHGSIREPQWVGGGIAFGPKPRDHTKAVPKKMKALALRSALSAKAREERLLVAEDPALETPSTKRAMGALRTWEVAGGRVLLVLRGEDDVVAYSFRNIPEVDLVDQTQLSTYDVIRADTVVFLQPALEAFQERNRALPRERAAVSTGDATGPAEDDPAAPSGGATEAPTASAPAATEQQEAAATGQQEATDPDAPQRETPEAGGEETRHEP